MLDRATLRTLAEHPERNDPALNVALAEEGDDKVLFALAECPETGWEALGAIAARVAAEGELVGHDPEPEPDDSRRDSEPPVTNGTALDARLIQHPHADDSVRDAVLARHPHEPFFVLAAAGHSHATTAALERAARWPSATPLHDRPWLALIDPDAVPPLVLAAWAGDADPLLREAAARLGRDAEGHARLATDASRRVRRALASNPAVAPEIRLGLSERDSACEVRARAALAARDVTTRDDEAKRTLRGVDAAAAAFQDAIKSMESGGVLAVDVARAVRQGPLDVEGARLAGRALDEASVGSMLASRLLRDETGVAIAAGIAMRDDVVKGDGAGDDDALLARCVRALAGADRSGGVVTGKGRLAAWLAEGVASVLRDPAPGACVLEEVVDALGRTSLAADRMVLGRVAGAKDAQAGLIGSLASQAVAMGKPVPIALLELAWREASVDRDTIVRLGSLVRAQRHATGQGGAEGPESEVDLDPRARELDVLERVGGALVGKAPLSPRAALALVALEPRRVRYVLSALPQWRGVLSGVHVARVLRAHAGALSAAGPSVGKRRADAPATWTQRRLDEAELAVALAIGDLAPKDAAQRLAAGQDAVLSGTALAAGMEARAALEGLKALEPMVELLSRGRSQDAAWLAAWLVIETLDRPRSAAAVAAALDAPWVVSAHATTRAGTGPAAGRSMVSPGIAEALATLERRSPGRLGLVNPQTPRGRAALVSGIARAYRGLGGMSVTEG
jgi:hypothetical protein